MSGWTDNDRPPAPQGMVGSAHEDRGIVPHDGSRGERGNNLPLPASMILCALGGALASTTISFVGPAMVSYGYLPVAARGGFRARACCLAAALVPAAAAGLVTGASSALTALVSCLMALAVVELVVARRMTAGALCVVVALGAAGMFGADEAVARANDSTVFADIQAALDYVFGSISGLTGAAAGQAQTVRDMVALLWPVTYVMAAIVPCVSALVGMVPASSRADDAVPRPPSLVDFDLPLWVVAVFVASVAGFAVAVTADGTVSQVALAISANVAMAVRFALAAQGLAVLVWLVRGRGYGPVATALAGVVALYLEVQFIVLTIAGLVDVWANFRRLTRGSGSDDATGTSMQD